MKLTKVAGYIFLLGFISNILLTKCASKVPPSGGPRDTIPPVLIYSNPKHQSTNVHSRVYEFTFNERIQLKTLQKQLIITPRIDFDYEIKQGKSSFILVFDEDFNDSTTYTFNFRDAIQDLTEGNPTENNKFTFSTGEYIDSLSIDGYTVKLLTSDTIKKSTVGLYQVDDTITIYNGSPYYFSETNEEGYFLIENIKNGKYLFYAFTDGNGNLKLDPKSEAYGWISDTLDLQSNISAHNILLYNLDFRDMTIQTALPSGPNFDVNFNKYIVEYEAKPLDSTLTIFTNPVKENKSIRIYHTFENPDSTGIFIKAKDSIQNEAIDTVWIKFQESSRKPEEFTLNIKPSSSSKIEEKFKAEINLSKPVLTINTDSILFRLDSIPVARINSDDQVKINKHRNKIDLSFNLNKKKVDSITYLLDSLMQEQMRQKEIADSLEQLQTDQKAKKTVRQASQQVSTKGLHLYLGQGAIISVENDTTEMKVFNYGFLNPEEYGTISGSLASKDKKYIIQLLSSNNEIVKELHTNDKFSFKNIKPGDYRMRLFIDENENGKWDMGNITKNEQPEPVTFYVNEEGIQLITVRANWDITGLIIE